MQDSVAPTNVDVLSMEVRFVELVPSIELAAGAKFEVVVGNGNAA